MYSFNKIHYINYIAIVRTLITTGLIVAFLIILPPSVYYVGIAYFCSALFSLILTISISRKVYEKIRISVANFSKKQFFEIITLAKWILVDQIGTLLLLQLSLILVNKELGTAAGGEYALVLIFFNLLWAITGLITSVLSPMYYTYFARGLFGSMHKLSVISVKCVGLVMALPIALICIFSPQLLTIWVGASFAHLSSLLWMLLVPMTMIVSFSSIDFKLCCLQQGQSSGNCYYLCRNSQPDPRSNTDIYRWFRGIWNSICVYFCTLASQCCFVPWYAAKVQGFHPI